MYRCEICRWSWEGDNLPDYCTRCGAPELHEMGAEEVGAAVDTGDIRFCTACGEAHSSALGVDEL